MMCAQQCPPATHPAASWDIQWWCQHQCPGGSAPHLAVRPPSYGTPPWHAPPRHQVAMGAKKVLLAALHSPSSTIHARASKATRSALQLPARRQGAPQREAMGQPTLIPEQQHCWWASCFAYVRESFACLLQTPPTCYGKDTTCLPRLLRPQSKWLLV